MKKILTLAAILAINYSASAQANYWNLNGSIMDCNSSTSAAGTIATVSYPKYLYENNASSFAIPGLCETYCTLLPEGDETFRGGGRYGTYYLENITNGVSPAIPSWSYYQQAIYNTYMDISSLCVGKLRADGSRGVYGWDHSEIVHVANISPLGALTIVNNVLYAKSGPWPPYFDRWTKMEMSFDGELLIMVGPDAGSIETYNLTTTAFNTYPAPSGFRIQGFEYIPGAPNRMYISYNNQSAANPSGTGGVGYYTLSAPSTLVSVTIPSGLNATGFGFSEIEYAKNGMLYLAYNSSLSYDFSNPGTVYSLNTAGTMTATTFTVGASDNTTWSGLCDKYYIQTQIDGDDYSAGTYATPSVIPVTVKLSNVIGFTGPSPSTPTIYTCNPELLPLNFSVSGLMNEYEITVRRGTISGTTFIPDVSYLPVGVVQTNYYSNTVSGLTIPALALWYDCDWKIEIKVKNSCSTSSTHNVYYRVRKPIVTAYNTKLKGINGTSTPSFSLTPLLYRCGNEPLVVNFNTTGTLSGYDVKVTKGVINTGDIFTPAGGADNFTFTESGSIFATTVTLMPASFVPTTFVGSDWKIEVTPKTPCSFGTTVVSYYKVRSAEALANYTAIAGRSGGASKDLQTTLPIDDATAPTINTNTNLFKDNIDAKVGWMGANRAGMKGVNTNGDYTIRVYEVDGTTGVRKIRSGITAPDVSYETGTGVGGDLPFEYSSYSFDYSQPPFYVDVSGGVTGSGYFRPYYEWAFDNSVLIDFSSRVYCAELTVIEPTSSCVVVKKSYFRIANNGIRAGGAAKTTDETIVGQEAVSNILIYPNPATSLVTIKVPFDVTKVNFSLMDNTGRKVQADLDLKNGKNEINIQHLPAGVYFYEMNIDGTVQHGKLVKQ